MNVTIYTKSMCPYCVNAKKLLESLGAAYTEVDVLAHPEERVKLSQKHNWMTVPMILIGDEFIGGFDDLKALHERGELLPKINA